MVNKHRLYWILQISGWLSYALLQILAAVFFVETGSISNKSVAFLFAESAACLGFTHILRNLIIRWRWLIIGMQGLIPRLLGTLILMGLLFHFFRELIKMPLGMYEDGGALVIENIFAFTFIYSLIFFIWSVIYFTYHYFERYNKSLKMEASMVQIELSNLKSQLNPHFIFNALNSIRALVDENPQKSKQAINQLSTILRSTLATEKRQLTKFGDELKTVTDYLGLEGIRFEERLKTEFDIDPKSYNYQVPPLMLQTLIENGIKHGISKLKEGGVIHFKTRVEDGRMIIQIRNSGQIQKSTKKGKRGLGVNNTIQRLKLIFGEKASFRILNENDKFVLTEITIPQI
ncbi:MAG TPA: histidine kinase [Cyclobacteriaceae bacterium]|nr:histidine kinase [Cyclobacteriaceae bacterium]